MIQNINKKNIYISDIEVYRNFFCIGFMNHFTNEVFYYVVYNGKVLILENYSGATFIENLNSFLKEAYWLVGYNSHNYDDEMLKYYIKSKYKASTQDLYKYSQALIVNEDKLKPKKIQLKFPFLSYDLMKLYGFHRNGFRKSLKQLAINLQWEKIQELPINPHELIDDDQVELLLKYNLNDILITNKLFEKSKDEIKLRKDIQNIYGLNVLNEFRSGVAKKLLTYFYEIESETPKKEFIDKRTYRNHINISECIPNKVQFQTPYLQDWLESIRSKILYPDIKGNKSLEEHLTIDGMTHAIKSGGIHSENEPSIYESNDEYTLYDFDFDSFYPKLMTSLEIAPAHLHKDIFLKILNNITTERLTAKKIYKQSVKKGEPDIINKVKNETLKIVINALYGLMGSEFIFLYDPLCIYKTCTAGQLYILMIIEDMQLSNFQCVMSNTDGCIFKVQNNRINEFKEICSKWSEYFNIGHELAIIKKIVFNSVNSYLAIKDVDPKELKFDISKETFKEYLDRQISLENIKQKNEFVTNGDIDKSISNKVIAYALNAYYLHNVPPIEILKNHVGILDFCIDQKVDSSFDVNYIDIQEGQLVKTKIQHANRFYCSNKGGTIIKSKVKYDAKKKRNILAELKIIADSNLTIFNDVLQKDSIEDYDINFKWYISKINEIINSIDIGASKTNKRNKDTKLQMKLL